MSLGRDLTNQMTYQPDQNAPPSLADRLGVYMVQQFLPGKQWQMPDDMLDGYVADVAPEYRGLVQSWILFYIAWLFRLTVAGKHGSAVEREMMAAVYYHLARMEEGRGLGANIKSWFDHLDVAGQQARDGKRIDGAEVPVTAYAAIRFMSADPKSPCRDSESNVLFSNSVIMALAKVHDDMVAPVGAAVEAFKP